MSVESRRVLFRSTLGLFGFFEGGIRLFDAASGSPLGSFDVHEGGVTDFRSEERRVGKECRCQWSPDVCSSDLRSGCSVFSKAASAFSTRPVEARWGRSTFTKEESPI